MVTLNEDNILQISNGCELLSINDETTNGMTISYYRDDIALSLCALYSVDEIKEFLAEQRHHLINSSQQTKANGQKKVLQTLFSKVDIRTGEENDFKVIFYSEGFMYQFHMNEEEWDAMISLMAQVTHEYVSM
jgi:hypothetical protein